MSKELEKRKDIIHKKFKDFFSNKHNILLLAILALAIIIRVKYTLSLQPLWWDEADYLNVAKNLGIGTPSSAAPWRARGIALLFAPLYYLGANEMFMRVVMLGVSVLGVYMTYLIGKEFFNKKAGFFAAFIMSVFWIMLFWTARFSMDIFSMIFWGFSALLFWKGYVKKEKKWYLPLSFALAAFGIFVHESTGFIAILFLVYIFLTDKWKFFKQKRVWKAVIPGCVILGAFFIYNKIFLGSIYPRITHLIEGSWSSGGEMAGKLASGYNIGQALTDVFMFWKGFPAYLHLSFFIMFLLGLYAFVNMILGFDLLIKGKEKRHRKELFIFLWILIVPTIFGIYLATTHAYFEPRYIFPVFPAVFAVAGYGLFMVYSFLKKYNKHVAIGIITLFLIYGGYVQVAMGKDLIDSKRDAFALERPAGEWLKEHTSPNDVIIACSQSVPLMYYSERLVKGYSSSNDTHADNHVIEANPKYLVVNGYHQTCNSEYPLHRKELLKPVKAFYLDPGTNQKPIIVIFEVQYPYEV